MSIEPSEVGQVHRSGRSAGEADRRRVESPCIGVCLIDERSGLCEGCLRTLGEVALWGSSTPGQRREILTAIERRRARLDPAVPPQS